MAALPRGVVEGKRTGHGNLKTRLPDPARRDVHSDSRSRLAPSGTLGPLQDTRHFNCQHEEMDLRSLHRRLGQPRSRKQQCGNENLSMFNNHNLSERRGIGVIRRRQLLIKREDFHNHTFSTHLCTSDVRSEMEPSFYRWT